MENNVTRLPSEIAPKTLKWRKAHLDWADSKNFFNCAPVRNTVIHKKINYDLLNGKLHMWDLEAVINPEQISEKVTPAAIQHYSIMNSKLGVLRGEEASRTFDYRVVITNPNAISEIEKNKADAVYQSLQQLIENQSQSEEEFKEKLTKMSDEFTYSWQDLRELRANYLLKHYVKEYNMPLLFNEGFMDAMTVGEEIYQCDIRGGEPIIERVNPLKIRIFKSGYSNKIEDADIIIMEDYWSPGKIIDTYYDVLSKKDIEYIENAPDTIGEAGVNNVDERDERLCFINRNMVDETFGDSNDFYFDPMNLFNDAETNSLLPFDTIGNIRVIRMFWKSRRKIKKVKSYDENGEEQFNFYPGSYVINKSLGEEETIYYINEAWEGTKIGDDIYVNMRPRVVQYNRLSNPSRCHFGIVGTVYNLNDSKPYSLVDILKSFNYLYDAVHDRLNKLISRNWGYLINLDLAKVPKGWDMDKWMYFARHLGIAVSDSFKEGNIGAATGKLAGALNNASSGVINAELGNSIQQYLNILEFIKMEMSEVSGITKQREGQISNRETVGGVERATLQSSHITEWLFSMHEDVKRRALECFLETAKIALKGRNEKFQYILPDGALRVMDIDGDEFAECDYGIVVDNSQGVQELSQRLDTLAQAALQTQRISFSTVMKLYGSASLAEKQRLIENDENRINEQQQQQFKQQQQLQQQKIEEDAKAKQQQMDMLEQQNIRDNETKILVAQINAGVKNDENGDGVIEPEYSQEAKEKLLESMRQFDQKLALDKEKLAFDKEKAQRDYNIKQQQLKQKSTNGKD